MDTVSISKYGWILVALVMVTVFCITAPLIGDRITGRIIKSAVEDLDAYVVTLDAGVGTADVKSMLVANGKAYGYLPVPVCEGRTFLGWYTAPTGGKKITSQTVYTGYNDHTLYALWA